MTWTFSGPPSTVCVTFVIYMYCCVRQVPIESLMFFRDRKQRDRVVLFKLKVLVHCLNLYTCFLVQPSHQSHVQCPYMVKGASKHVVMLQCIATSE